MSYPKGYNPPGGPNSSGGSPSGSYPKPKRRRRGAIAAVIIIIFLFVIGVGAYSSTKQPTTQTSSNLETSSNLGSPSEQSTSPSSSGSPSEQSTSPSSSGSPSEQSTSASPPSSGYSEPESSSGSANCDPSYPDFCIPSPPPDLDCPDVSGKRFTVSGSDPHGFDRDGDGVGCES
jgi:cytoskeletal protein RodZ